MFYTYILLSLKSGRFYTGHTEDISRRLEQHNRGENKSTRNGIPWKLIWFKEFPSRSQAMLSEKKIKSRGAKRFLQDIGFY